MLFKTFIDIGEEIKLPRQQEKQCCFLTAWERDEIRATVPAPPRHLSIDYIVNRVARTDGSV